MAYRKVKEVADMLGVLPQHVNVWKSRGKINVINGIIDDTDPVNKYFIEKQKGKREGKVVDEKKPKIFKEKKEIKKQFEIPEKNTGSGESVINSQLLDGLKAEKTYEEIQLLKLKKQKTINDLLPINVIIDLINISLRGVMHGYHNNLENMIIEISNELGLSREASLKIKSGIKESINKSTEQAKKACKRDILNRFGKDIEENE